MPTVESAMNFSNMAKLWHNECHQNKLWLVTVALTTLPELFTA